MNSKLYTFVIGSVALLLTMFCGTTTAQSNSPQAPICDSRTIYFKYYWVNGSDSIVTSTPTCQNPGGLDFKEYYTLKLLFYSDFNCTLPMSITASMIALTQTFGPGNIPPGGIDGVASTTFSDPDLIIVSGHEYIFPTKILRSELEQQAGSGNSDCVGNIDYIWYNLKTPCTFVFRGPKIDPECDITPIVNTSSTQVCYPNSITLCAQAVGAGYTYTWTDGINSFPPSTDPCITISNPGSANMYCQINTGAGCTFNTLTTPIRINPLPDKNIQATYNGPNVDLCSYEIAIGTQYQWYKNGIIIPGEINRCYTATSNGDYYCRLISSANCIRNSDTVTILGLLPVKLEYFRGTKQGSSHLLDWKVSCANTQYAKMSLEISKDGRNFSSIYSIRETALRCQQPFNYANSNPFAGINYYRLRMEDDLGVVSYSSIVVLINGIKGFELVNIAPNPVTDGRFKLNITSAEAKKMEVFITDIAGRVVQKQQVNVIAGFTAADINVSNLAGGNYQLYGITAEGKTRVLQLIKK